MAIKIGPSPSAGIDVAMGSLRPSSFASLAIRDPIRPPPITIVSALSAVRMARGEDDGVKAFDVLAAARAIIEATVEQRFIVVGGMGESENDEDVSRKFVLIIL